LNATDSETIAFTASGKTRARVPRLSSAAERYLCIPK
jgi:hypothetical protein